MFVPTSSLSTPAPHQPVRFGALYPEEREAQLSEAIEQGKENPEDILDLGGPEGAKQFGPIMMVDGYKTALTGKAKEIFMSLWERIQALVPQDEDPTLSNMAVTAFTSLPYQNEDGSTREWTIDGPDVIADDSPLIAAAQDKVEKAIDEATPDKDA